MSEEELKNEIATVFLTYGVNLLGNNKPFPDQFEYAEKIIAIIRNTGWRPSPTTLDLLDELMGRIKKNLEGGEDDAEKIQRNRP